MNPLKKTDPLLTDSMRLLTSRKHTCGEPDEQPQESTKPCEKLHVRPTETGLGLNQTVRELAIHWALRQGPSTVAMTLQNYADLLRPEKDGEPESLFRQVILEMIAEQQKQDDSPNRKE